MTAALQRLSVCRQLRRDSFDIYNDQEMIRDILQNFTEV